MAIEPGQNVKAKQARLMSDQEIYGPEIEKLEAKMRALLPRLEEDNRMRVERNLQTHSTPERNKDDTPAQAYIRYLKKKIDYAQKHPFINKYDDLRAAIPEAQLRAIEQDEYHKRLLHEVLSEHEKVGVGGAQGFTNRVSLATFRKQPMLIPPSLNAQVTPEERSLARSREMEELDKKIYHRERYVQRLTKELQEGNVDPREVDWHKAWILGAQEQIAKMNARYAELQKMHESDYKLPHEKYNLTGFDKKGRPLKHLDAWYKSNRGTAHFNKEGDLVTNDSEFVLFPNTNIRRLARAGVIHGDERTSVGLLPRPILKKIDPQFKEYFAALDEVAPFYPILPYDQWKAQKAREEQVILDHDPSYAGVMYDDKDYANMYKDYVKYTRNENEPIRKLRRALGRFVSFRGLKNIAKSSKDKDAVRKKLKEFFEDYSDELEEYGNEFGFTGEITSLNDIDRLKPQILLAQQRREYMGRVNDYLEVHPNTQLDRDEIARRFKALDERAFEYDPDLAHTVKQAGWSLMSSPAEMKAVADGRCYGDIARYGPIHFERYRQAIREGKTLFQV